MKKYWRTGPVECEVDGVMSEQLAAALEQLLSSYPQLSLKLDSLRPPLNRYGTVVVPYHYSKQLCGEKRIRQQISHGGLIEKMLER